LTLRGRQAGFPEVISTMVTPAVAGTTIVKDTVWVVDH
jgi:hypothetical protein